MTGWLSKEILVHLEHAGYVAIPKEQIELLQVRESVSDEEQMNIYHFRHEHEFQTAQRKRMAHQMAKMLLERGFIDVHIEAPGPAGITEHIAILYVLKPRTINWPL